MLTFFGRLLLFVLLTLLTEVGGVAYLVGSVVAARHRGRASWWARRVWPCLTGLAVYAVLTAVVVPPVARAFGRVRLPCGTQSDGPVVAATRLTCALNRGYVRPSLLRLITELAADASRRFPGSKVTTLEGNFPLVSGFPLLPHLSHRDGKEADVAYFYRRASDGAAIPSGSPSWFGYFVYERPTASEHVSCSGLWTPLRWNLRWFQPSAPEWVIDEQRTAWMLRWLKERPEVRRMFIEPYLAERLGVAGGKVHFQGCQAARHDDHIHIEVE